MAVATKATVGGSGVNLKSSRSAAEIHARAQVATPFLGSLHVL